MMQYENKYSRVHRVDGLLFGGRLLGSSPLL
jgi:hypothetical protein